MELILSPENMKQMESAVSSVVLWFEQTDLTNDKFVPSKTVGILWPWLQNRGKKKKTRGSTKLHYFLTYSTWISTWKKLEIMYL